MRIFKHVGRIEAGVDAEYFPGSLRVKVKRGVAWALRPSGLHGVLAGFLSMQCNTCGLIGERNLYMFQFVDLLYDQMSVLF